MTDTNCLNIFNIDDLNDDCLIHIFTFLRIPERFRIERVCKRWQSLALVSWLKVRRLELDTDLHLKDTYTLNSHRTEIGDANNFKKVLELCGPNLSFLGIDHDCIESTETILSSIHTLCPNIKAIEVGPSYELAKVENIVQNFTKLRSFHARVIDFRNEDFLAQLFRKNQKLESLELENCCFSAECFSYLNHESIIELDLNDNYTDSIELLANEIKKFKNLLYLLLKFGDTVNDFSLINKILKAANPHTVIYLYLSLISEGRDLSRFRGLHINQFYNLEEFYFEARDNTSRKFLDDKILQSIAQNCSKLRKMHIFGADNITDVGFTYIINSLQITKLSVSEVKISDTVISKAKSLEDLSCYSCPFVKIEGIMTLIETSQIIREVNLHTCQAINPEGLIDSVKKSPRYVLELKVFQRLEGRAYRNYEFRKVGNQLRLRVKGKCDEYAYPETCGSGCAICGERVDIYPIE